MKLIIDIDEEVKHKVYAYDLSLSPSDKEQLIKAILNGIPVPDNGEWVDQYNDGNWHCSKCGAIVEKDEQINHNWYFCYHCGTKMNAPVYRNV